VAYCYGLEKEAVLLRKYLEQRGFKPVMVSCTVDGLKESQINPSKSNDTVSCNPIGQANLLNSAGVDFTILMGLCLGHDMLLQKNLQMDFTTFIVKDRVFDHNPLLALHGNSFPEDAFIENMDNSFHLIKTDDFKQRLQEGKSPDDFYLLDLRSPDAYNKDGLLGSINCLLNSLPKQYKKLLPDKSKEIIAYCNGGIQSVYAVMFLSIKGYKNIKGLAGGISKYFQ
jgi:rhodanese-related sulfurtransferase